MDQAENLRKLAMSKAAPQSLGPRVIAVASGKGGTGKTSFCINLGISLSMMGKPTMILDADFGLSNVDVMLDARSKHNIGEVLRGEVSLSEAVSRGHGGIWYVAGGTGAEELANMPRDMAESFRRQMFQMEEGLEFILIDCGAGVSDVVMNTISAADECLAVLTPEPTSLTDAFVLLKSLSSTRDHPPVSFIMNRAESPVEAVTMARYFKNIVQKYLHIEPRFLGYVSFDKEVMHSIKKQMPMVLAYPGCQAAKDVQRIAALYADTLPEAESQAGGLRRFFDRIVKGRGA